MLSRTEAKNQLNEIFNIEDFYDKQWEVISKIVNDRKKVLFIEKTSYGKSLCYQFPATIFKGTTIVFSPLIALMRDQVRYLKSKDINAETINCEQTDEENAKALELAKSGKLKLLYIAPERQENSKWIDAAFKIAVSFIVIDEAHCISTWGHDFRPSFRRIANLVKILPDIPVLATTATATQRTAKDILEQIGGNVDLVRGNLFRENLELNVINLNSEIEKMAWIAENLNNIEGNGIIYTGTRADSEKYSDWLKYNGYDAIHYNAGLESGERKKVEENFMNNEYKCVVSTNALGMGIDKPDIRFVIHTQFPSSPINYYQEVGRAGRDGKESYIFLLFNEKNKDLIISFINGSKPSLSRYYEVIEILKRESLKQKEIIKIMNIKQNQVGNILADLIDQKIIFKNNNSYYEYNASAPKFDFNKFEKLREIKFKELEDIIQYCYSKDCRMNYLCNYLDDNSIKVCGKCDNCLKKDNKYEINKDWKQKIQDFLNDYFPIIEFNQRDKNLINGIAASYYGSSDVGKIIHHCKYENGGNYPDSLVALLYKAFKKYYKDKKSDYILFIPPTESGSLVKNFAYKFSEKINVPVSEDLVKIRETQPQKNLNNSIVKKENVKDAFNLRNSDKFIDKSVILIDDIYDSGATIKEIGKILTCFGVKEIMPLVIAKTVSGDI